MANTTAGAPLSYSQQVGRRSETISCPKGRELAIRNTGTNTLWISVDGKTWYDVACGTSWDSRMEFELFHARTKIGVTTLVVLMTT